MVSERLGSEPRAVSPPLPSSYQRTANDVVDRYDLAMCRYATQVAPRDGRREAEVDGQVTGGQASKGIRWMPWHQEAMKDVAKLRKAAVSRKQASTRRSPNRETDAESCRRGLRLNT